MKEKNNTYVSPLGFVLDEGELNLRSKQIDGVTVLDAVHLIPLKIKAWADLSLKKENGTAVDTKDIKKHKNDVYRLCTLLTPETEIKTPAGIYNEMQIFIEYIKSDVVDLKQLGIKKMTKDNIVSILRTAYIKSN